MPNDLKPLLCFLCLHQNPNLLVKYTIWRLRQEFRAGHVVCFVEWGQREKYQVAELHRLCEETEYLSVYLNGQFQQARTLVSPAIAIF